MRKILGSVMLILTTICFLATQTHLIDSANPLHQIENQFTNKQSTYSTMANQSSSEIPVYSVYLSDPPLDRYKKITEDKKVLLGEFIDYLYQISNFKYSMWLAKVIFSIFPQNFIRNYLGWQFFDECKGIAQNSGRQIYQIVVYNYMYEIGAAKDFCTSIAVTQTQDRKIQHKQNLSILARNLDYGFQQFLARNTIRINFYQDLNSTKPLYTTFTHAGFISTHTLLKYETQKNLQFGLTLNQRKSQNIVSTLNNIVFYGCESVFQLTNRLLQTGISSIEELISLVSNSKTCSKFYFIIQAKDGDHVVIQKNEGIGAHMVYFDKAIEFNQDPFFVVQTNTDKQNQDPDGRRDQAISKLNRVIDQKGYVQKQDLKRILLEAPNFNDQTLMTALIDVGKGQIEAIVWDIQMINGFLGQNDQKEK